MLISFQMEFFFCHEVLNIPLLQGACLVEGVVEVYKHFTPKRGEALVPFGGTWVATCKSGNKLPHSKISRSEISDNLRTDPFSHRNRNAIADHSVRIIGAAHESKRVGNTLEPRVLSNRVRPHALRKSPIDHQSGAQ